MRNLTKTLEHIERVVTRGLDAPRPAKPSSLRPAKSATVWRANDAKPQRNITKEVQLPVQKPHDATLTVKALKISTLLNPTAVMALAVRDGQPRVQFVIGFEHGELRADVSSKSLRKVQKAITENGVENVNVMLQGRLGVGEVKECGLTATVKTPKKPAEQGAA
jgi:hypothetical protein